jgi:hypothetical protein
VLTTHLLMQQVGWRRLRPGPTEPFAAQQAGLEAAHPHRPGDHSAHQPAAAEQAAPVGARARVRAAYDARVAAGQTPTGAGLARAAGVSERYGQRLLAEFTADPARASQPNGDGRPATAQRPATRAEHTEGR